MKVGREGEMEKLNVTPDLIQELQQFEEKKSIYMVNKNIMTMFLYLFSRDNNKRDVFNSSMTFQTSLI